MVYKASMKGKGSMRTYTYSYVTRTERVVYIRIVVNGVTVHRELDVSN